MPQNSNAPRNENRIYCRDQANCQQQQLTDRSHHRILELTDKYSQQPGEQIKNHSRKKKTRWGQATSNSHVPRERQEVKKDQKEKTTA